MRRTFSQKHIYRFILSWVLLTLVFQSGCEYHDGGVMYHTRGTLIDASTKEPLADMKITTSSWAFDSSVDEEPNWPGFSYSDKAGTFSNDFRTGISWGYQVLFGIIPIGSTNPPIPHELKTVVLAVQPKGKPWHIQTIQVTPTQQKQAIRGERWIELGTITIGTEEIEQRQ